MPQAVFLSYASQDADAARRICEALRAEGLEVWFDQSELRGGDAWDASIRRQIRDCALFVPVISANTDARPEGYFRLEWKLAVDRSHLMADDQPFLLPVVIDDTHEPEARVPDRFRERQWSHVVDQPSAEAFAQRVRQLAEAPPRAVPKRPSAPAASAEPASPAKRAATRKAPSAGGIAPSATNRTRVIAAVAAAVVIATSAGAWFVVDHNRKQAFIAQGMTNIESLVRSTRYMEAYRLAGEVERAGGAALLTETIREGYSRAIDVTSSPEGAAIAFREYRTQGGEPAWIELGAAPLAKVRLPRGVFEWRATLPAGAQHTLVAQTWTGIPLALAPIALAATDATKADLLPVPAGDSRIGRVLGLIVAERVELKAFSIDRTEVTNRQYAQFVQAGGYAREEFWKHPFRDGARMLGFKEAMARFKDATGRPGPAHWKLGSFPDGEGELPVRGISWHEASAYAAFAGKSLPTIYHWYFADSGNDFFTLIPAVLPGANFEGKGPRAAKASRTISRFGAIDMAGNVREWVATPTDKGRHIAVGGSWLELAYQYKHGNPFSAFDRPADVGFRCMSTVDAVAGDIAFAPAAEQPGRDLKAIVPVKEAEYAVYSRLFEQRSVPPDARVESTDATKPHWTRLKVSYATGYGEERMDAYLYLPRNAAPPYQTVIYMPGSGVFSANKPFDELGELVSSNWQAPEMLVRGGRAVLYPLWKGSFERHSPIKWTRVSLRERLTQWVSDLRQSVVFLHSRKELDVARIGFFGYSLGAAFAPNLLAMEPRVKAAVLLAGGLEGSLSNGEMLSPEIDSATFAPRTKVPVLMLNGRSDIRFPYETSQVPLFNLLGSPPGKKKHKTYPGGHYVTGWYDDMVKDTHDWFDEHFGPVVVGTGK